MDWLEAAKRLPLGHKRRVRHDCSENRDMVIGHDEIGYSAYCHRCGPVGNEKHGYRNLEELQRLRELNSLAQEPQSNELPKDFTTAIPKEQACWLFKAGITVHRAADCGIGWSPSLFRIVIPLYGDSGDLLYWQARAVRKGQVPKYTNPPIPKTNLLYWVRPRDEREGTSRVVVTEDILSAIRIGKHVTAASILGTKTSDSQAAQLSEYARVDYWLDPDSAGVGGSIAGTRKMALLTSSGQIGNDCPVDPKNLPDRELREILGLTPNHRYVHHGTN